MKPKPLFESKADGGNGPQARRDLLRMLRLFAPYWQWMAAGVLLSLVTVLANVALMAVSGWFIASMALAGLTGAAINYFTPAALIRGLAITRTIGRYLERIVTHDATLRLLARLRVWFYLRIEPLAPACLQGLHSADMLSRIQADIDTLNHVYLRVFAPIAVAVLACGSIVAVMAAYSTQVALLVLVGLLLAGAVLPWWLYRQGREPGRQIVALRAALRETVVDGMEGLGELRVYGALEAHQCRADALRSQLCAAQRSMSRLHGGSQGALLLCATLALWGTLCISIALLRTGALATADLAMLALFVLASFEAVWPLPTAMQMLGESLAAARPHFFPGRRESRGQRTATRGAAPGACEPIDARRDAALPRRWPPSAGPRFAGSAGGGNAWP